MPRKQDYPLGRFETGLISWWSDESNGTVDRGEQEAPERAQQT